MAAPAVLGGLNLRGETGRSALGKRKDGQEHVQVVVLSGDWKGRGPEIVGLKF